MAGLKLAYGGSIPPFLVSEFEFVQRRAPQMCDKVGGSRGVILHWLSSFPLIVLLA